jgi:hypothetical protein
MDFDGVMPQLCVDVTSQKHANYWREPVGKRHNTLFPFSSYASLEARRES